MNLFPRLFPHAAQWRRNQIAVTTSAAFIFVGYTLVIPFLAVFVRELGITSDGENAFWCGLILSASPLVSSFAAPIWGRIGDKYGMRLIAQRATLFNALLWFSMGFVQDVYQLLAIRVVLGLLGGFSSISVALLTQACPQKEVPRAIGTLQAIQILGTAIGPLFGGLVAQAVGVRNTFFVTGIVMVGSVLSVSMLYRNIEGIRPLSGVGGETSFRKLKFWRRPEYFTSMMILFFVNMADRTFGPILTLFLSVLGTPEGRLVLVSGALVSGAAFAEAFSAWISGRLVSRISLRSLITGRLVLSILVLIPMVFVGSSTQFSVLRILLALLAGGTLTLALSAANHVIPEEHRGSGFALLASTSTLGNAAGPLISGLMAKHFTIPSVFVFNSVIYLLMIGFVFFIRHKSPAENG